ncbi:MAG: CoA-binding protein [Balneolaceae bacterium]
MKKILQEAETIVIIGCSEKKYRASYMVAEYLKGIGRRIIPVNPHTEGKVLGEKVYESINELPEELEVDVVDIFRNRIHTADTVRQVIRWAEKRGQQPVIWTQLNVSTEEAGELAGKAGLVYVKNKCILAEYQNLSKK